MKYFSMFSGIGGFELGIKQAYETNIYTRDGKSKTQKKITSIEGLEERKSSVGKLGNNANNNNRQTPICIGYSEIDKYAIQIYEKHFNHKNYGNATEIDTKELPDFDFLVGGFPCQAFSIAGKRKGFDDTRGTLFFEIARILRDKRPRHILLENVKGLLSHDKGKTFQTILGVLSDLGYGVEWQVLNSKNFGVPQNRERVFISGYFGKGSRPKIFPITESNRQVGRDIKILAHKDVYRRANQVYDKDGSIETLSTCGGGGQHPCVEDTKIRRLTPTECERLQGFPDDWTKTGVKTFNEFKKSGMTCDISDTQRYKCLGNAVTVNVIQAIIERLNI